MGYNYTVECQLRHKRIRKDKSKVSESTSWVKHDLAYSPYHDSNVALLVDFGRYYT